MLTEEKRNRVNQLLKEISLEMEPGGPRLKARYNEDLDQFEYWFQTATPFSMSYEHLERVSDRIKPITCGYALLEQALRLTIKHIEKSLEHVQSKLKSGRHSHD